MRGLCRIHLCALDVSNDCGVGQCFSPCARVRSEHPIPGDNISILPKDTEQVKILFSAEDQKDTIMNGWALQ